jgi:hypothetical protein
LLTRDLARGDLRSSKALPAVIFGSILGCPSLLLHVYFGNARILWVSKRLRPFRFRRAEALMQLIAAALEILLGASRYVMHIFLRGKWPASGPGSAVRCRITYLLIDKLLTVRAMDCLGAATCLKGNDSV